jgi:hypothetical protein
VPFLGNLMGTDGDGPGWKTLGLFVVSALAAIVSLAIKRALDVIGTLACAIPALLAGAYALYEMLDMQRTVKSIAGGNELLGMLINSASVELGLVLVVAMGIAVPVASAAGLAFTKMRRR